MPALPPGIEFAVFDPVTPFKRIVAEYPGLDTWFEDVVISKELADRLPHLASEGTGLLEIPAGIRISVPKTKIGLQIGKIRIPEISALIVESGTHDVVIGSNVFKALFSAGAKHSKTPNDVVFADNERDTEALSVELYPVETPFPSVNLEEFLKQQRRLYNITLIAERRLTVAHLNAAEIDRMIDEDYGIPAEFVLQIASVSEGSVWIALKSGSASTLKYLAGFFQKGASAKLAEQVAAAKTAESQAHISKETRDSVAKEITTENEKLQAEHIHDTYNAYRKECKARLAFLDDLIGSLDNPDLASHLKRKKSEAIMAMAEQQLVPVIRNLPGAHLSIEGGRLALPMFSPEKT